VVDPFMTETAQLAHYVLPPTLSFERPDHTGWCESMFGAPFAQYTPPILPKAAGVLEDWEIIWEISAEMNLALELIAPNGMRVGSGFQTTEWNPRRRPTSDQLLADTASRARVSLDEVKAHLHGALFEDSAARVLGATPEATGQRLQMLPDDVAKELDAVLETPPAAAWGTHLLVPRRDKRTYNTQTQVVIRRPGVGARNPAYMHSSDLSALDITAGTIVEIVSQHGRIAAVVEADDAVRPGVVSMTHGWGGLPDDEGSPESSGTNPQLLVSTSTNIDPINHMPRMSAIPVTIQPL
jgi:anaerobic selenocysteine-containing dehydrogenase